jgi:hypothetical protein
MKGGNFNWFLHTMLFMHTVFIIEKQEAKKKDRRSEDDSEDEDEDESDEA